MSTKCDKN